MVINNIGKMVDQWAKRERLYSMVLYNTADKPLKMEIQTKWEKYSWTNKKGLKIQFAKKNIGR